MRIGVDLRPLLTRSPSGVSYFAARVLPELVSGSSYSDEVVGFANSWRGVDLRLDVPDSVRRVFTRYPNKFLHGAMMVAGAPRLEWFNPLAEVWFLPNFDFFATNKPYVVTVHDLSFVHFPQFYSAKQRAWHRLIGVRGVLRRAAAVVAVSESTKADVVETFGVAGERVFVAPLAPTIGGEVGMEKIEEVRARYGLPERFVLNFGDVSVRKNVVGLVEAFARVKTAAGLVIGGAMGFGSADVVRVIAGLPAEVRGRIRLIGYVRDEDRAALYAAASVFVYPSYAEGFGLPPLEAMSVGVPVVASDIPAHVEVLGDDALLADPYNVVEIVMGIEGFLEDSELAREFGERGRRRAALYDWGRTGREVRAAIQFAHDRSK